VSPRSAFHALAGAAGLALALGGTPTLAQPGPASALSEEADQLLRQMSAALAGAPSLALDVTSLREVQLADGRAASLLTDMTIAIRRPDRLRADIRGDAVLADVYYDGRRVTVHAIPQQSYAQADAPPSIDGALALLQERLGVPLELGALLVADPHARLAPGTTGDVVSTTDVSGRSAWHLVLQSGPVAWELWLDRSGLPLPLLASVVRDGRRLLLRFDAWRVGPTIADRLFQFTPPPGARPIPFAARQAGDTP